MTDKPEKPPAPTGRAESREIIELRRLKEDQPDLAAAVDLQIELLQLQRRVQLRVPLPSIKLDTEYLNGLLPNGPILQFEHLPIDWSDVRFLLRATASAMRNHDALEEADVRRVDAICRDASRLPAVLRSWYDSARPGGGEIDSAAAGLELVFQQALRPVLTRCADAILAKTDLAAWHHHICPLCAGEPDLAVITRAAERLLICSRCAARWRFDQIACPFCLNDDRTKITSLASRDGRYRLSCCDSCRRYIKAFDARRGSRPVLPPVDGVATLPLDAAAIQRGYS
ncbi:MAG TPA: formate dehydrogenase accessory protein FdhE [Vicinamibacterales bacterium]|nr:formate dehydrogenase accessory protein FdhE [Vicinamibacterales bacterium]